MKNLIFTAVFYFTANSLFATIRTVSNSTLNPGQFSTIQAAVNAASANDTIYVHPSSLSYSGFSMDKKLTIIGGGFEPSTLNQNLYTVIDGGTVALTHVNASFSKIIALQFNNSPIDITAGVHDVLVARCRLDVCEIILRTNVYNITIAENMFFEAGLLFSGANGTARDIIVINNVFRRSYQCCGSKRSFQDFNGIPNVSVINNLFYSGGAFGNSGTDNRIAGNTSGLYFSSNIFNRVEFGELSGCTFSNCITNACVGNTPWINNGTDLGVVALGTQNISNTPPDFTNAASINGGGYGGVNWFVVNPASPTLSSMPGDPDMGPYGGSGSYNFNRASASNLPYVYSIVIGNPSIQAGTDLNIDVVGKKHD